MKDELQSKRSTALHDRCWGLLPWWVNGTLPVEQVASLEQHVSECAECAAEVVMQRNLHAQLRDGDAVLMAPQGSWQKMSERLDAEEDELASRYSARASKSASATGVWHWAVAAQALIIVGLASMWWQGRAVTPFPSTDTTPTNVLFQPRYETLTSGSQSSQAALPAGTLRVVFRRDIALAEVNAMLRELSMQIVAGPSEAGVFTLSALVNQDQRHNEVRTASSASTSELLKRLRSDARVIFAEPQIELASRPAPDSQ